MLASASTGTAIASLSGAAATNATLAWLGGGSLAAGGMGMAGGMAVLGGIVVGPAVALAGLVMDSKAEENLTAANQYRRECDQAIEQMKTAQEALQAIQDRADELQHIIEKTTKRFNQVKNKLNAKFCQDERMKTFIILGKQLKELLDMPILDKENQDNVIDVVAFKHQITEIMKIGD